MRFSECELLPDYLNQIIQNHPEYSKKFVDVLRSIGYEKGVGFTQKFTHQQRGMNRGFRKTEFGEFVEAQEAELLFESFVEWSDILLLLSTCYVFKLRGVENGDKLFKTVVDDILAISITFVELDEMRNRLGDEKLFLLLQLTSLIKMKVILLKDNPRQTLKVAKNVLRRNDPDAFRDYQRERDLFEKKRIVEMLTQLLSFADIPSEILEEIKKLTV